MTMTINKDTLAADLRRYLVTIDDLKGQFDRTRTFLPLPGHTGSTKRYRSREAFLLAHARAFEYAPRPAWLRQDMPGYCYCNAALLALAQPEWLCYVEGMAASGDLPLPFDHAWVVDRQRGLVIDTTWDERGGNNRLRAYFGIPFTTAYLARVVGHADNERFGLIDRWEDHWPLMTGAHDLAEAIDPLPLPDQARRPDGPANTALATRQ